MTLLHYFMPALSRLMTALSEIMRTEYGKKNRTKKRRPMPKHIYSIHQLRDFIRLHDDLRAAPDKKRGGHYSTLVYRLKNKLEVPDLEDLHDDIRRIVDAFDRLQHACKMKKGTSVILGSTHLLSVRLVPSLLKAYRLAMDEPPGSAAPEVELVYDMHYRKKNEREFYAAPI